MPSFMDLQQRHPKPPGSGIRIGTDETLVVDSCARMTPATSWKKNCGWLSQRIANLYAASRSSRLKFLRSYWH